MLENDMIQTMMALRIAQSAVMRRPAAPAPVTPAHLRVWGPRASRRPGPDLDTANAEVRIPLTRDPQLAAAVAGCQPSTAVLVAAVPSPRLPAAMAQHSGLQVVDA